VEVTESDKGRLLDLPANNRLLWKLLNVANTLACYGMELIVAVKSFLT
jgi:hypothetical protein